MAAILRGISIKGVRMGNPIVTPTPGANWIYRPDLGTDTFGDTEALHPTWNGTNFLVASWTTGKIATSSTGANWVLQNGLLAAGWGNSNSINGMGSNGSSTLVYGYPNFDYWTARSTDGGVTWALVDDYLSGQPRTLTNNGSTYLIAGDGPMVAISTTDGVSWTESSSNLAATGFGFSDVLLSVWNGTVYTVVGTSNGKCATSPDGETWTYREALYTTLGVTPVVAAANPSGVILLLDYNGYIAKSSGNGATWTADTTSLPAMFGANLVIGCVWDGSKFVVLAQNGDLATSTDGDSWTYVSSLASFPNSDKATDIAYGSGKYIVVGNNGYCASSPDLSTWTFQSSLGNTNIFGSSDVYSLAFGSGNYLACGPDGKVATSTDAITWTYQTSLAATSFSTNPVTSSIWDGTKFMVAGGLGALATSTNGISWSYNNGLESIFSSDSIFALLKTSTNYVAIGDNGTVGISADGNSWSAESFTPTSILSSAIWGNGIFLASDANGNIFRSTDAVSWTNVIDLNSLDSNFFAGAFGLNWNGTQFMAGGFYGVLATSPDGISWTLNTGLSIATPFDNLIVTNINWNGTQYLATGHSGSFDTGAATSPDGISWTYQASLSSALSVVTGNRAIFEIIWSGTQYVVSGYSAVIATSSN